ncbi:MAG: carbohydrate kinase [Deltaproteobacteria bacterium]|nr:carbohydrate kinase [Deltaproteobacteria bacterium]
MTRPVVFGELLYDVFPDGHAVLGGAPFNVARHLRGFGLDPLMISRVGDDERGRAALAAMRSWGMDTAGVQIDPVHPTGEVRVRLDHGQPTFEIVPDRAWDHIDAVLVRSAVIGSPGLVYHGSLALRSESSRDAFAALTEDHTVNRFLDVNLRSPWWKRDAVIALARDARWVKLNEDEATILWGDSGTETAARQRSEWGCEAIIMTRGERGADVVTSDTVHHVEATAPRAWVDAVGAGDAFAAVVIAGMMRRLNWPGALHLASRFAAEVCAVSGALGLASSVYDDFARMLTAPGDESP